jgi:peroxiredoxin/outer membrane lipoprotein-sorting protein
MRVRATLFFVSAVMITAAITGASTDRAEENAKEILLRVAQRYRAMTVGDMWVDADVRSETAPIGMGSWKSRMRFAWRPDRQRTEMSGDPIGLMTIVTNRDSTWCYWEIFKQYTVTSARVSIEGAATERDAPAYYSMIDVRADGARIVGRSAVGSREIAVIVLEPDTTRDAAGSATMAESLWVDTERDLVVKNAMKLALAPKLGGGSTTFSLRYAEPSFDSPPDSLFVFSPPPGARRVSAFAFGDVIGAPKTPKLGGASAPLFELRDLSGRQVTLSACRGKVVLLDFWATWCGPCRLELPHIDKLNRDLGSQGLVVLAVTSESRDAAATFMKANGFGMTCLIDEGGRVFKSYGIQALPTVVIVDRKGTVSEVLVGVQTEESLTAAVRRAGVE